MSEHDDLLMALSAEIAAHRAALANLAGEEEANPKILAAEGRVVVADRFAVCSMADDQWHTAVDKPAK